MKNSNYKQKKSKIYRSKEYWEYLSLQVLKWFYYDDIDCKKGRIKDKPDIRMIVDSKKYGIEVLRIIQDKDAQIYFELNKYYGNSYTTEYIKNELKKQNNKLHEKIKSFNNITFCDIDNDMNNVNEFAISKIIGKFKKYSKYEKFDVNGLFVIIGNYPFDVYDIQDTIGKINNINPYDIIFFFDYENLLIYTDFLEKRKLPINLLKNMIDKSLKYAIKFIS